jgi:macrolide transport system ATP-binding/permease protein
MSEDAMRKARRFLARVKALFLRRRMDADFAAEIEAHVAMIEEELKRRGMTSAEARREARLKLGGVEQARELHYGARTLAWLESLYQDARFGFRMLRKNPGFTLVAIVALVLGIGLNTAVFTAYKTLVTRPVEARNPKQMVNIALVRDSGAPSFNFSYPDYESYRDSARTFSGVVAFSVGRMRFSTSPGLAVTLTPSAQTASGNSWLMPPDSNGADFASVFVVSENYFQALGVAPIRGRDFSAMSAQELAASPSVLLSENYWQKEFSGDPSVLGRAIYLNGAAFTIVGMMPRDFEGTGTVVPNFWMPASVAPLAYGDSKWLTDRETARFRLFARLRSGANAAQARSEMQLLFEHLRLLHKPSNNFAKAATVLVWQASPFPLPIKLYPGLRFSILLIMAASAMVLAVACADVGSLQLARARSRQYELRTRLALGASRARIIVQLLTESALLGMIAGGMAFLLSWALLKEAVRFIADTTPADYGALIVNVTPDLEVFFYVLAISLTAGILFGLAPALEGSRAALASSDRGGTSTSRNRRIQEFLVGLQVAFSLTLMIAGTLLIRSSLNSLSVAPGYETKRVVDLELHFPDTTEYTVERKAVLIREIRSGLEMLPDSVAVTSGRPPGDDGLRTAAVPSDESIATAPSVQPVHYTLVQPNYFQTLGIPLVLGRTFNEQGQTVDRSLIASESAARQLWPGQNPLGRSVRLGSIDEQIGDARELHADGAVYQVVGVARDTRGVDLNGTDSRQFYLPLSSEKVATHGILVRTSQDAAEVARQMEAVVSSVDVNLVVTTSTLEDQLRSSTSFLASSVAAAIASTVGLLGFFPALMGIYGTVSYIVVMRTREIGIRMAIGAQRTNVLLMVLGESLKPVLLGLNVGLCLAAGASYLLRDVLFGVHLIDVASFGGIALCFFAIASLAAFLPARRAMRVDPMVALRYE